MSEEAVGKGGRKTPTRLTPDPFVKGEVKDTSKDPVGGATGGGKISGYGGEGLQGPVPDRPQNPLARLASRQAQLRNKAEARGSEVSGDAVSSRGFEAVDRADGGRRAGSEGGLVSERAYGDGR